MSYSREQYNAWRRSWEQKQRSDIHDMYGHCCAGCGESERAVLTLDHVLGDGAEHRRLRKRHNHRVLRDALRENDPSRYRILCMNCQFRVRAGIPLPKDAS